MSYNGYTLEETQQILAAAAENKPLFYKTSGDKVTEFNYDDVRDVIMCMATDDQWHLQLDGFLRFQVNLTDLSSDSAVLEDDPDFGAVIFREDELENIVIEKLARNVTLSPELLERLGLKRVPVALPPVAKTPETADDLRDLDHIRTILKMNGSRTIRGTERNGRIHFSSRSSKGNYAFLYFQDKNGYFWVTNKSVYNSGRELLSISENINLPFDTCTLGAYEWKRVTKVSDLK